MIYRISKLLFCLLVFGPASLLHAEILPEIKGAYFYPTDKRFRDIYSGGGLYTFEVSACTWCHFYPFASVGYFRKSGSSLGEGDRTTFQMVPVGLGLKYFFNLNCTNPYLGAGVLFTYARIKNHSHFVRQKQSDWGVGGIFKAGFLTYFWRCFFIDIFGEYSYMKIKFDHKPPENVLKRDANVSGFSAGGGLGFCF